MSRNERAKIYDKAYRDSHKETARQYHKTYYAANRDKLIARELQRYLDNRETIDEKRRIYRNANIEKYRERERLYYIANREHIIAQSRKWDASNKQRKNYLSNEWAKKNKDKRKISLQRRRALINNILENTFTFSDWNQLVARSKVCHWCKKAWNISTRPTHDHVIPISKGGQNSLENSVAACRSCNSRKSNNLINPVTGQGILL